MDHSDPIRFHQSAKVQRNEPSNLRRHNSAVHYRVCGQVDGLAIRVMQRYVSSEHGKIHSLLINSYNNRHNALTRDNNEEERGEYFDEFFKQYVLPIYELLKRYKIRSGIITQNKAKLIDWEAMMRNHDQEYIGFVKHVKEHSKFRYGPGPSDFVELFIVDVHQETQTEFIQIRHTEDAVQLTQFLNSLADGVAGLSKPLQSAVDTLVTEPFCRSFHQYPKTVEARQAIKQELYSKPIAPQPPSNTFRKYAKSIIPSPPSPYTFNHQRSVPPSSRHHPSEPYQASTSNQAPISKQASTPNNSLARYVSPPHSEKSDSPPHWIKQKPASTPILKYDEVSKWSGIWDGCHDVPFIKKYGRQFAKNIDMFWPKFMEANYPLMIQLYEVGVALEENEWQSTSEAAKEVLELQSILGIKLDVEITGESVEAVEEFAEQLRLRMRSAPKEKPYKEVPQFHQNGKLIQFFIYWTVHSKFLRILYSLKGQEAKKFPDRHSAQVTTATNPIKAGPIHADKHHSVDNGNLNSAKNETDNYLDEEKAHSICDGSMENKARSTDDESTKTKAESMDDASITNTSYSMYGTERYEADDDLITYCGDRMSKFDLANHCDDVFDRHQYK